MNRTITFAAGLIVVWIIGYLMIAGRGLIIPFILAVLIWNLLNILQHSILKLPYIGSRMPKWIGWVLSYLVVAILVKILIDIIGNNVNEVIQASSRYQENLMRIFNSLDSHLHIRTMASLDGIVKNLSVQHVLVNIYGVFTTLTGSAVLIALYVLFLFMEQHYFKQKLDALIHHEGHRQLVDSIISHITKDTQIYLGIKTLLSLITATASWIIMKIVGLDFAEFWALLIFFLNYIPNIGAIVATAFPAFLALIQFQTWWPFIVVTSGIVIIQFVIGNFVEPKYLSKSLNLSPLIILIALSLWGAIWGILGMFLSVPITVIMMIIFAHFNATRPIAIFLSKDGYVKRSYESID